MSAPASSSEAPPLPSNPERKARKEAAKALKAQQAADRKAAASAARASTSSSSTKPPRQPQSASTQLSKSLAYILRHGAEKEGLAIRPDGYIALKDVLERPRVKSVNMAEGEGDGKGKRKPGLEDVKRIVECNDKKRFELMQDTTAGGEWYVRAVQGHSLKQVVELEHTPLTLDNLHLLKLKQKDENDNDDDDLVDAVDAKLGELKVQDEDTAAKVEVIHGTYAQALDEILSSGGLKPMTRNHIHLAKGRFGEEGVISGMRKSANRLIYIDIAKAIQDGVEFLLSSNGVVLTPGEKESGLLSTRYFTKVEDQKGNVMWKL